MLVQIPVYLNYVLTRTETVTITNPNPIVHEVEAKEDHVEDGPKMVEPTIEDYIREVFGDQVDDPLVSNMLLRTASQTLPQSSK